MAACVEADIDPLIAAGRESHHLPWQERFSGPPPLCAPADAVQRMRHRLKTRAGRASYGQRKQTVEPVFGIIKSGDAVSAIDEPWKVEDRGEEPAIAVL